MGVHNKHDVRQSFMKRVKCGFLQYNEGPNLMHEATHYEVKVECIFRMAHEQQMHASVIFMHSIWALRFLFKWRKG